MEGLVALLTAAAGLLAGIVDALIRRFARTPNPETAPGTRGRIARWAQENRPKKQP